MSIESLPPEIHTATQSPSFTSSYSFIAFVNFDQIDFLKRFLMLSSTSAAKSASLFSALIFLMSAISHAIYPPLRLSAPIPCSCNASASSKLVSPLLQYKRSFLPVYSAAFSSSFSPGIFTLPLILPYAKESSSLTSMSS